MGRKPIDDPELIRRALEARAKGISLREVARIARVAPNTVRKWEREAVSATPPPVPAAPPPDEDDGDRVTGDIVRVVEGMLEATTNRAKAAEAAGNYTAAQRAGRDAGELVRVLARVRKERAQDGDAIRVTRAEIDDAMAAVMMRVKSLLSRPLTCARCGAAIAVELAGAEPVDDAPERGT